ncbi:uncharacterized protein FTJAE_11625 [Fusarium tjaetaba]|uniref:Uncharacterized protein n=1 Tax=Fusarium tjaetaba TaxID=1567544 RepID=A0A8H5QU53_9HYPO|nr:uncharacterized protein FTJAE_11625 [Fusarium tjaetaba]KAF5620632.1 hypothetical protein FTJAE_11625 [Fusarium tjaetaba]
MSTKDAPPAQKNFTVVVPMAVQALVVAEDFPQTDAQFAPLIEPDYATLLQHAEASAPSHDLMDDLNLSYWRMQARYSSRFINPRTGEVHSQRCGVYLSWCLPRLYRTAITATESAMAPMQGLKGEKMNNWESRKARAGFKCGDAVKAHNIHDEAVQFRPSPDRWIIVRQVRNKPELSKHILVESNRIRKINEGDIDEDFELSTCPAMDPYRNIEDQPLLRMGRSSPLAAESETKRAEPCYKTPFNAFELGHEYFADYAPHNMGVFSYFDNLDGIDEELVDYSVIGFHSSATESDPFTFADADKLVPEANDEEEPELMSNKELLDALHLKVDLDSVIGTSFSRTSASIVGRTLTQGVLRNVRWNRKVSQGFRWPAASLQRQMYAEHPIAIGTHMLDALEAYLHLSMAATSSTNAKNPSSLSGIVIRIMAEKDDPDSLRKAAEDAATQSFLARPQGIAWALPKDESESEANGGIDTLIPQLHVLNQGQRVLDTCSRECEQLRQRLFNCWWNAASLRKIPLEEQESLRKKIRLEAEKVTECLTELKLYTMSNLITVEKAKADLEKLLPRGKKLIPTPTAPFGQHQDPNVLVAGAKSGWPEKFNDTLSVRLASQVSPDAPTAVTSSEEWLKDERIKSISRPVLALLRELESPSSKGGLNPYEAVNDMNNTQGWFPLFLEWELEYYHVPFEWWELENDDGTCNWRYTLPQGKLSLAADETVGNDMRVISGRTAFLPEPGKSLHARLEQLFAQTPTKNDKVTRQRTEMLGAVSGLEYFSSSLSGFSDHLVTLLRGHHPRPVAGDDIVRRILNVDDTAMKELETNGPANLAPYGVSTPLPPSYTANFSPFKPVTHGQARFTKFAIVDKFGQVVSGIRLGPGGDGAMYPSISPSLACHVIPALQGDNESDYWPNTVVAAEKDPGLCQFFQIPPRINQPARLNTHFLKPISDLEFQSAGTPLRHIASEWDNPVWAWVLPNFHNHGIQVYAPEGDFVIEVLLIDKMAVASDEPVKASEHFVPTGRLAAFVDALSHYEFCHSLFDMLAGANDSTSATEADVDMALPAALGRPFCIADVGLSIELSAPPLQDASLLSTVDSERQLDQYSFPVVLGNHRAGFDGLVGTFNATGPIHKIESSFDRDGRPLTSSSPGIGTKRRPEDEHPQPLYLKPYFLEGTLGGKLEEKHLRKLTSISAIMDPKMPIHVYSGSLFPVGSISLPRWFVEKSLGRLRAFFTIGPILIPTMPLSEDSAQRSDGKGPESTVQMPLGGGDGSSAWRWLQPRKEMDRESKKAKTKWYEIGIMPLDKKLKVDSADESQLVEGHVIVRVIKEKKK